MYFNFAFLNSELNFLPFIFCSFHFFVSDKWCDFTVLVNFTDIFTFLKACKTRYGGAPSYAMAINWLISFYNSLACKRLWKNLLCHFRSNIFYLKRFSWNEWKITEITKLQITETWRTGSRAHIIKLYYLGQHCVPSISHWFLLIIICLQVSFNKHMIAEPFPCILFQYTYSAPSQVVSLDAYQDGNTHTQVWIQYFMDILNGSWYYRRLQMHWRHFMKMRGRDTIEFAIDL